MPPSQKQIDIYEALKELGERTLRGEFGRGDGFDEALYSEVYGQLLIPIIFPDLEDDTANVPIEQLTHNVLPAPEETENAEKETASDCKEDHLIPAIEANTVGAEDSADASETVIVTEDDIGSVEDVLGGSLDGSE